MFVNGPPLRRSSLLLVSFLLLLPFPARGQAQDDAQLAQLEALLQAQQQRVEQLKAQLATAAQPTDDAARVELMRTQIREILGDQQFRESLMPTMLQAGYDKAFFIRSSDDKFLLNFHGRMQFRWTHYGTQSRNYYRQPRLERDDRTGFDVRRIRFTIDGHAYSKDLTYLLELQADGPTAYDFRPLYAWLNYRFAPEFQVKMGLFQLAATRAGFASSANMQFPEYPEWEYLFTAGTGVGVRFWGQAFENHFEYFLDVVNSVNGPTNRTITPDPAEMDNNPAIVARAVWHACGEAPLKDFAEWGDITHHENPCVDLGAHYIFNDDAGDRSTSRLIFGRTSLLPGGFGITNSNGVQMHQIGMDGAFKWQGFSVSGEYAIQVLDPRRAGRTPFAPLWLLTAEGDTMDTQGAYLQSGYFLPIPGLENKLEVVARVQGIRTNAGETEGTWFYGGGLNYYIEGNRVKLQTDVVRTYETPFSGGGTLANANDEALIWRVQLQVAF